MGMTSIVFREGRKNIENFSTYLSAEIPLKTESAKNSLSQLWAWAQAEFNWGKEKITNVSHAWTSAKTTINEKKENVKTKCEVVDLQKLTTSAAGTAFSALVISYYRPDHFFLSLASYLIKPALFLTGTAILIAGNARGSSLSKEEVVKNPLKRLEPQIQACMEYVRAQHANQSARTNNFNLLANKYGSLALTEILGTLTGTATLFVECGGDPKALKRGLITAELALIANDLIGLANPGMLATAIVVMLAAGGAMGAVIYNTPLPEIQQEIAGEKEET
ncbi:MAG TPA: hypothetical protein DCE71_04980 [Parachlamydiales bacterium]|nr:hypothetical protein [Parachlamydiales bacterium]